MKTPSKSCELDQIPTDLLNTSLQQGTFPMELKKALQPLLQKATLEFMIKKNFRLVSNLVFSHKFIECIVADQMISYIDQYNLMEEKQPAYRKFHSTKLHCLR